MRVLDPENRHALYASALLLAACVVGLPAFMYLFYAVHLTLSRVCVRHARRFCVRHRWTMRKARWAIAFDEGGVKTEFTVVQLDVVDAEGQRRLIELLTWPFGVRRVLGDEPYPDQDNDGWPGSAA